MASNSIKGTDTDAAPPARSTGEADNVDIGYASREELTVFLNALLEAERAGARVTLESAREAGTGPIAELMLSIQRDEARWCAMLSRHLKALGEVPSPAMGAFHGKAMAIADMGERLVFLNRGQGWVVRKLRETIKRVRDDGLSADLTEMLVSHEANIALAGGVSEGRAGYGDGSGASKP
jgi:hypothetical protein